MFDWRCNRYSRACRNPTYPPRCTFKSSTLKTIAALRSANDIRAGVCFKYRSSICFMASKCHLATPTLRQSDIFRRCCTTGTAFAGDGRPLCWPPRPPPTAAVACGYLQHARIQPCRIPRYDHTKQDNNPSSVTPRRPAQAVWLSLLHGRPATGPASSCFLLDCTSHLRVHVISLAFSARASSQSHDLLGPTHCGVPPYFMHRTGG